MKKLQHKVLQLSTRMNESDQIVSRREYYQIKRCFEPVPGVINPPAVAYANIRT